MTKPAPLPALLLALSLAACTSPDASGPPPAPEMPPSLPARPISPTLPTNAPPALASAWPDALLLQNDAIQAVIVPSLGRLIYLAGRGSKNVYRCDPSLLGKIPGKKGHTFFNIGGDWLWPVAQTHWTNFPAQIDNWPPPKILCDAPWNATNNADGSVTLTRHYPKPLHITVTRTYSLCPPEPGVGGILIQQSITRTAPSKIPVTLWNVSQIASPTALLLPLAPHSAFPNGLLHLAGPQPPPHTLTFVEKDSAVYRITPGAEIKLGSDAGENSGAVAAIRGTAIVSLLATDPLGFPPASPYPDGGCSHEVYANQGLGYAEIETLSPEVPLPPGETIANRLIIRIDLP